MAVSILIVNVFFSSERFTLDEKIENAYQAGNPAYSINYINEKLKTSPKDVALHRAKIFALRKTATDTHEKRLSAYRTLLESTDRFESDLGKYSLGLYHATKNEREQALEYYLSLTDQAFPYLNNSIGATLFKLERYSEAKTRLERAISLDDNASSAWSNLSKIYLKTNQHENLKALLTSESSARYIPRSVAREYYFATGQWALYVKEVVKRHNFDAASLLGALLTMAVWLTYLIKIDIFERENPAHIAFAFALGVLSCLCALPLYDFYSHILGLDLTGGALSDFLYCIFAIGVIEEGVKIIPFLILLRFKSIINETTDYIVYASLLGLGFAFLENLLYFHPSGLDAITSRFLTANFLHMALTSFIAYSLLYAKLNNKSPYKYFALGFLGSVTVHGVYDFLLITSSWFSTLRGISFFLAMGCMGYYALATNYALNRSEFNNTPYTRVRSARLLVFAILAIVLYQYIALAIAYGSENANINLLLVVLLNWIMATLVVLKLGRFDIVNSKYGI